MQSILPESYETNAIGRMIPGDMGYTHPWAMYTDEDRRLWINAAYPVTTTAGGTSHLQIERTQDGVIVYQKTIGDHRYSIGGGCFVGHNKNGDLPVSLR